MGRERPSGTVTFLFTEVEDSTRWSEDVATDMAAALQRHDAMVRDAIESQGGYVFATDGDCFSAVFSIEGLDEVEVLGHLDSLVRKSLVVTDHTTPRTRYRLFETIRQFAEDRLSESGGLERMRDRHAAHFGHDAVITEANTAPRRQQASPSASACHQLGSWMDTTSPAPTPSSASAAANRSTQPPAPGRSA